MVWFQGRGSYWLNLFLGGPLYQYALHAGSMHMPNKLVGAWFEWKSQNVVLPFREHRSRRYSFESDQTNCNKTDSF